MVWLFLRHLAAWSNVRRTQPGGRIKPVFRQWLSVSVRFLDDCRLSSAFLFSVLYGNIIKLYETRICSNATLYVLKSCGNVYVFVVVVSLCGLLHLLFIILCSVRCVAFCTYCSSLPCWRVFQVSLMAQLVVVPTFFIVFC